LKNRIVEEAIVYGQRTHLQLEAGEAVWIKCTSSSTTPEKSAETLAHLTTTT